MSYGNLFSALGKRLASGNRLDTLERIR